MAPPASPETVAEILCDVEHVSHEFTLPSGRKLVVLQDISLSIRANEIVALLGPSGCGKSTILRILAGLIRPTASRLPA